METSHWKICCGILPLQFEILVTFIGLFISLSSYRVTTLMTWGWVKRIIAKWLTFISWLKCCAIDALNLLYINKTAPFVLIEFFLAINGSMISFSSCSLLGSMIRLSSTSEANNSYLNLERKPFWSHFSRFDLVHPFCRNSEDTEKD